MCFKCIFNGLTAKFLMNNDLRWVKEVTRGLTKCIPIKTIVNMEKECQVNQCRQFFYFSGFCVSETGQTCDKALHPSYLRTYRKQCSPQLYRRAMGPIRFAMMLQLFPICFYFF